MRASRFILPLLALALLGADAGAQDAAVAPDPAKAPTAVAPVIVKLHPQSGKMDISGGLAWINLPPDLGYLSPDDTDTYLHQVKHVPGKIPQVGSIVPTTVELGSPASWITLIQYREDGFVLEAPPQSLDPLLLLKRLQQKNDARNAALKKGGFGGAGVDITGWEEQPHYDSVAHTLVWALDLHSHSNDEHLIIYNIRILGRHGVLSLTLLGKFDQLPMFENAAAKITSAISFNAPNRYSDFAPTDKRASYTVADMVTDDTSRKASSGKPGGQSGSSGQYMLSAVLLIGVVLLYKLRKKKKFPDGA